jgi:hypothetical protein
LEQANLPVDDYVVADVDAPVSEERRHLAASSRLDEKE